MDEHFAENNMEQFLISLGNVKNAASIKINGREVGTVWCEPWEIKIPKAILKGTNNVFEITVANLWVNRLIGCWFTARTEVSMDHMESLYRRFSFRSIRVDWTCENIFYK